MASTAVTPERRTEAEASPTTKGKPRMNYWARHTRELRRDLAEVLPVQELRRLHQVSSARHLWVTFRQFLFLGLGTWGLVQLTNPLLWIPLAVLQGFVIFNFTVMLHEIVHENAIRGRHEKLNRLLGLFYAIPSGISASQFTRWHLDHHDSLGHHSEDPKRHHLSPKQNRRLVKLLYFTPGLFFIYFRAARLETMTYSDQLRKKIRSERLLTIGVHVAALSCLLFFFAWPVAVRVYFVPYVFVFPVAFALNRLAQHYYINPEDPAQWGTLMKKSRFWDFAYLWSSYHLEHHYFPRVPFYNLPKLRRLLQPFFDKRQMEPHGYLELLYGYLVRNHAPHTDWSKHLD